MKSIRSVATRSRIGIGGLGLLLVAAVALSACKKPEIDDCREACWNFAKLRFWANVDRQVKELPPNEAAKVRAAKEVEFKELQSRQEDSGHLNCTTECQQNASPKAVKCMIAATTEDGVQECIKK